MNKICAIGVYFGELPAYFSLWLKSAQWNSNIDFYIFTDCKIDNPPLNVKVEYITLREMKALAEKRLMMPVSLNRPYKCCDFKPVYGIIFEEYVKQYEYWGHFDVDLIMGDLYGFMMKYHYQKYDKFMHLGHFSFYRNNKQVNNYYKLPGSLVGDYKKVFSTQKSCAFDELLGIGNIYLTNNISFFYKKIYADISCHYKRFRLSEQCCLGEKIKNYKYQVFYWQNGKIYRTYIYKGKTYNEEFAYIHLQKRPDYAVDFSQEAVNAFYIGDNGFMVKDNSNINKKIIKKINDYPGFLYEFKETMKYNVEKLGRRIKARIGEYR